jgi:histone-lysine N-methyltransferase SETMAR
MLEDKLKPDIRSKRRGLLSQTLLLHHDNARPHAAAATIETIQKLNFELLPRPSYSPDLAPSDYRLFGLLKMALRGSRFGSDEEVKQAVHSWLCANQKQFSVMELRSLLNVVKSVWISKTMC